MELIIIFGALALIGSLTAWNTRSAAAETEATIRLAIEKGVLTDASLIPALREPAGLAWVERFILLGMIVLFAAGGIMLVATVLMVSGTGIPVPLFALSAFAACLGGGLIHCGRWLRRTRRQP